MSTERNFWESPSEALLLLAAYEHAKKIASMQKDVQILQRKERGIMDVQTNIDVWSCERLTGIASAIHKNAIIQTEEAGLSKLQNDAPNKYTIDELDGSANFAAGLPNYQILIGRQPLTGEHANVPDFGAVFYPASGTVYWGEHGIAAYANERQIRVNPELNVVNGHVYLRQRVRSPADKQTLNATFCNLIDIGAKVLTGPNEAFNLSQIASGNFVGAIVGPHAPGGWHDIAGPLGLVRAAGAHITDWRGQSATEQNVMEHGVVVANSAETLEYLQGVIWSAKA